MGPQLGLPDVGPAGQHPRGDRPAGRAPGRAHTGCLVSAAVIGRDFDAAVLARVAKLDEDTLIDLCDRAVTAALLTEADKAGWYTFAHALIEHTLYDGLSAARRVRAHQTVAQVLEELSGDDPASRIGELAYHWAHATQPQNADKAIHYAQRAGDHALEQLAPDEALRWFGEALVLLGRSAAEDPYRRATLLLGLGEAQRQTGDAEHRATLLAAGRLADEIDAIDLLVRAALRNNRGWNSMAGAIDHERVDLLTRALTRSNDHDSPDRARLLALLCVERIWDADFDERLSMATHAVDMARRTGDKPALVDAIRLSREAITMPETIELRLQWSTEACVLAAELGDPTARLHANEVRMLTALEDGDLATMRSAGAIFESECDRIGQPLNRWQIAYHSLPRMLEGEPGLAEQSATDALTLGTAAGFPEDAMTFYGSQLMVVRWMQGRMHEMTSLIEEVTQAPPRSTSSVPCSPLRRATGVLTTRCGSCSTARSPTACRCTPIPPGSRPTRSGPSRRPHRPSTRRDAHPSTPPAVEGPVRDRARQRVGERGALPRTARPHPRSPRRSRRVVPAGTCDARSDGSAVVRGVHPGCVGGPPHGPQPARGRAAAQALVDAALPVATESGYGYIESDARSVLERIG